MPFTEALDYLASLRPITADELEFMEGEILERVFRVAEVFKLETLQSMLDSITSAFTEGTTLGDFLREFEGEGLGQAHLETVFRTNMESAFGRGIWDQGMSQDVANEIWGWRYHTVGDDRVREEHEELDELIFQTGERDELFPPWDFNCRCSSEWISLQEAIDEGYESSDVPESVDNAIEATEFTSPALDNTYEPDLSGFDNDLLDGAVEEGGE